MKTIRSYRCCISLAVFLFGLTVIHAEPVNREAPAIYHQMIEKELTPLEPLLGQVDYFSPEKSDHGCILRETIVYVDDEGHTYKALSNGDLDNVGSDLFSYRPETDKIYLIKAEGLKALEPYVRYSMDDRNYKEARELVEEAKSKI